MGFSETMSIILSQNTWPYRTHRLNFFLVHEVNFLGYISFLGLMEKAMATHSSTLAWKIPWMEKPGRLQSTGSLRVRHDWATSLSLFTFMHWRRKWRPTPVFLPGESHGWRSLVGCSPRGRKESDTTELLHFHFPHIQFCICGFYQPGSCGVGVHICWKISMYKWTHTVQTCVV